MGSLIPVVETPPDACDVAAMPESSKALRDSLIVTLGGQLERALGTFTTIALRWGLEPGSLGVYTGLRLYLDNTNRTSLGVGLGAVQEIPILRASGRFAEAERVANLAHTTNTLTCLVYSLGLLGLAWWQSYGLAGSAFAAEWTWGLAAVAGLALLKRYESFLIAVLRAYQEFSLTTQVDVVESIVSAFAVGIGLWVAGFWGLLVAVAVILVAKIAFLHARHPLRFRWVWDAPLMWRLMVLGLPILANTAAFGALLSLDRVLILTILPDGEKAAGLYTIAILGTSWSLDLAGRIVTVMYTYFQTTLGRTNDPREVARLALRTTEAQTPWLLAGSAVAYLVGPVFLGTVMPRYVDGLPAIRPLLPGMTLLGLAWPARQFLITIERPYRLALATVAGLVLTAIAATTGGVYGGIVGVAWGMSLGYAGVFLFTSAAAYVKYVGVNEWARHLGRLGRILAGFSLATLAASHVPLGGWGEWPAFAMRCGLLAGWLLPTLFWIGSTHGWGGLMPRRLARRLGA